jgi:hypothetical protein
MFLPSRITGDEGDEWRYIFDELQDVYYAGWLLQLYVDIINITSATRYYIVKECPVVKL